jgi:hypothetical protein
MTMDRKLLNSTTDFDLSDSDDALDLDDLLHPGQAFEHPSAVVNDPDLTLNEKRAILASWASDACAIEAAPALRRRPGSGKPVQFDDIMDALRALDEEARAGDGRRAKYKMRHRITEIVDRLKGKPRNRSGNGGLGSLGLN